MAAMRACRRSSRATGLGRFAHGRLIRCARATTLRKAIKLKSARQCEEMICGEHHIAAAEAATYKQDRRNMPLCSLRAGTGARAKAPMQATACAGSTREDPCGLQVANHRLATFVHMHMLDADGL
jgi:hypothetical protein